MIWFDIELITDWIAAVEKEATIMKFRMRLNCKKTLYEISHFAW